MIELADVTKSYPIEPWGKFTVFRGLNLRLPSRVHIGILGRNGAGKSTLMRLLGGTELPDSGKIVTDGVISPPLGLASGFAPVVSGRDNARFVCRVCGDDSATIRERVEFIHKFSELGEFFERPVQTYSSGMRARLAFSISMSFDYDYYLIDELTAVGDKRFRDKAERTFKQLKGRASIIMASHNMNQLKRDCEVGVYLNEDGVHHFDDIADAVDAYEADQSRASV